MSKSYGCEIRILFKQRHSEKPIRERKYFYKLATRLYDDSQTIPIFYQKAEANYLLFKTDRFSDDNSHQR